MGRPQSGQAEEVTSGASGRAGCSAHAEVRPDERVYAGDGGRGVVGKGAVSEKAVHLASTCRGGVFQKEGSPRWRGKEATQPHTVGRAEARSEGGSDVETWAACRRSRRGPGGEVGGRGEAKGENVSRVCAHGAAREGRAPQRAAVKAYSFVYDVDDEMGASRGREKHPCFYDASGGF